MAELNCVDPKKPVETYQINWTVPAALPSADGRPQPGLAGPVAGIVQGRLVVGGGANFPDGKPWRGAKKMYHDDIYFFDKKNDRISDGRLSQAKLPQPIAYCASVGTPQGLVYIGGENEDGLSDKVVLARFHAVTGEIEFSYLPSLPLPLTNLSAVYVDNKIYAGGGNTISGNSEKFYFLDLSAPGNQWQALADLPVKISFAVMVVQSNGRSNCIYLFGGRRKNNDGISDIFNSVYQFDIQSNRWEQKGSIPYKVSAGTGIARGHNAILLFGGDKGETFSREEKLNAAIRIENDEARKILLISEKIALLEAHPGFTGEVLVYNTIKDEWQRMDDIIPLSPVTTTALNWDDAIILPSGEIKAGVRTPQILMGIINQSR